MASLFIICVALFYLCFFRSSVTASSCSAQPIWLPLGNCTITQIGIPDVISWGAAIGVGNSSQELCFVPSTAANNTLIISSEVCSTQNAQNETAAQCRSQRGNYVDRPTLTTTSLDSLQPDPGWAAIMSPLPAFQYAVDAVLELRSDNSVDMPEGLITQGQNYTTSHLGLGIDSELLEQLATSGMIPARTWALNSGSQSVVNPRDGSLVLGGFDQASVKDNFVNYDMNYPVAESSGGRDCPLQVTIQQLILRPVGGSDFSLSDESSPIPSCIEPYDNLLRLPTNVHGLFQQYSGWSAQTVSDPSMLVLEPGLIYPNYPNSTGSFNASLIITLNNGFQVEIPNYELQHPLRGLAANGSRVLNPNITEVQVYADPVPLGTAVLGKVFLSEVYLAVDYDKKVFKLAHLDTDAVIPVPVPFEPCPSNLSPTSIGLIIVGIVLALLLLIIISFLVIQKWRKFLESKISKSGARDAERMPQQQTQNRISPSQVDLSANSTDGNASELANNIRNLSQAQGRPASTDVTSRGRISEAQGRPAGTDATSRGRISEVQGRPASPDATSGRRTSEVQGSLASPDATSEGRISEAPGSPASTDATSRRRISEAPGSPASPDATSGRRTSGVTPANPAQGQDMSETPHSPISRNTTQEA